MLKAVLFDLDNTLYAYEPCHKAALAAVYQAVSRDFSMTQKTFLTRYHEARAVVARRLPTQAAGHSRLLYFQYFFEQLEGKTCYAESLMASAIYWEVFFSKMKLRPGIKQALRDLKKKNIPCALVSDLTVELQMEKILNLKLENDFQYLVTSEEVGVDKPNVRPLKLALKKLGCRAAEVVLVGDSLERDEVVAERASVCFLHLTSDADGRRLWKQLESMTQALDQVVGS